MTDRRFQDQHKRIADFQREVWVECPNCGKKAVTLIHDEKQSVQLLCAHCGRNKRISTKVSLYGITGHWRLPANAYFGAKLWLIHPFKNEVFWAYNEAHLTYLEAYIGASLREHKDRTHFTLLEKLPKFYHDVKNREALLKIIKKLRDK